MKISTIAREAWQNICSGTTRALLGTLVLAILIGGALTLDGLAARAVLLSQKNVVAAGAATILVSSEGRIDGVRCLALGELNGVRGAVALRSIPERLPLDSLPATRPALYEYAGDPLRVLGGSGRDDLGGVLLSSLLAEQLHAEVGSVLPLAGEQRAVDGMIRYPDDGRTTMLASAALARVPVTSGRFDSCLYTVWPLAGALESFASTAVDSDAEAQSPTVTYLNTTLGTPRTTVTLLDERATRVLVPIAAGAAALLGFLFVWMRRLELAVARHIGQSRGAQSAQLLTETLPWSVVAALLGTVTSVLVTARNLTFDETTLIVHEVFVHGAGIALATLLGTILAACLISPRAMQRWAKDR